MRIEPYKEGEGRSDPFSRPFIDNYVNENESKVYLTREDILELGFYRTNPDRKIWQHKDKKTLFYEEVFDRDYGIKDFIVCRVTVFYYVTYPNSIDKYRVILYTSKQPNKEDIQQVIDNYAA